MNLRDFFATRVITQVALAFSFGGLLAAGTIDYNLTTGWSNSANPNGVWSYDQGTTPLPFWSNLGTGTCANTVTGITGGYANLINAGNPGCTPAMYLTTGSFTANGSQDWAANDVMIQAFDPSNGGTGLANVFWTAPVSGTVVISGSLWYGMNGILSGGQPLDRTNNFTLTLASALPDAGVLNSGSVGWNTSTGSSFASPLTYSDSTPLQVNAGDKIDLQVVAANGSVAATVGVTLDIQETSSATPEPATALLTLIGIATAGLLRKRLLG